MPISPVKEQTPQPMFFFSVAGLAIYMREEAQKQRHMNILLELPQPQINKAVLNNVYHSALERLKAELDVDAEAVKDFVIMNISLLGHMAPEDFHSA